MFSVVVETPDGTTRSQRLPLAAYQQMVAATNFKQRVRKMMEYYHADRLRYAVVGTPNRLEYDQGFFVKNGDGAADFKPIAHLYKTQVYRLAEYLGVPAEIRTPPAHDRHLLAGAVAGGVLLLAALRQDGRSACTATTTMCRRRRSPPPSVSPPTRSSASTATSTPSAAPPTICRPGH